MANTRPQSGVAMRNFTRYPEMPSAQGLIEYAVRAEKLGHAVTVHDMNSGLHAIAIDYTPDGRVLTGGVDPRREGVALGD